jgi:hypothetical protein
MSAVQDVQLVERIAPLVDDVVSIGQRFVDMERVPTVDALVGGLTAGSTLLIEIEAMFTPELHVEVVPQLRRISQRTALIVAWPGRVADGRVSYSAPGRADHVDEPARDLLVLRPVRTDFPDEIPYRVERYPA